MWFCSWPTSLWLLMQLKVSYIIYVVTADACFTVWLRHVVHAVINCNQCLMFHHIGIRLLLKPMNQREGSLAVGAFKIN